MSKFVSKISLNLLVEILKTILGWFIVIPSILVISPLCVYKLCVSLLVRVLHRNLIPVSAQDSTFVVDKLGESDKVTYDHERNLLNNIGFCFEIVEEEIDLKEFTDKVQKRLIDKNSGFSWRLKYHLVRMYGYTFWDKSPDFQISHHIRKISLCNGDNALHFLNSWATKPYAPQQPLWEFLIVDGHSTQYVAFKCHHSLGDGLTLCEISNMVFETEHHPMVQEIFCPRAVPRLGILTMVYLVLITPAVLLDFAFNFFNSTNPFQIRQGIETEQFTSVQTMDLKFVKSIAKSHGVSLASVLLTIFSGGIQRFLKNTGRTIPDNILIPVPQPWPGRPKYFIGNRWNVLFARVPLNVSNSLDRVKSVQNQIIDHYSSGKHLIVKCLILSFWVIVPTTIVKYLITKFSANCSLSPLLCPDEYKYNGKSLKLVHGIGGLVTPTFGILCGTLSHKNKIIWTAIGAKDFFKTKEALDVLTNIYFVEELKELLLAAPGTKGYANWLSN